jgi:hypothetical protein
MKNIIKLLGIIIILATSTKVHADQFAWNSLSVSSNAIQHLQAGTLVISYCSQCDGQRAELWRVERAVIAVTDYADSYEVTLFVQRLFQTKRSFDSGEYKNRVQWQTIPVEERAWSLEDVDLAYIYVRQPDGSFRVLADVMKLTPLSCATKTIQLPAAIRSLVEKQSSETTNP